MAPGAARKGGTKRKASTRTSPRKKSFFPTASAKKPAEQPGTATSANNEDPTTTTANVAAKDPAPASNDDHAKEAFAEDSHIEKEPAPVTNNNNDEEEPAPANDDDSEVIIADDQHAHANEEEDTPAASNQEPTPATSSQEPAPAIATRNDDVTMIDDSDENDHNQQQYTIGEEARDIAFRNHNDEEQAVILKGQSLLKQINQAAVPQRTKAFFAEIPDDIRALLQWPEEFKSAKDLGLSEAYLDDPFVLDSSGKPETAHDITRAIIQSQSPEVIVLIAEHIRRQSDLAQEAANSLVELQDVILDDSLKLKNIDKAAASALAAPRNPGKKFAYSQRSANKVKHQLLKLAGDHPERAYRLQLAFDHVSCSEWAKIHQLVRICDLDLELTWKMLRLAQWERKTGKGKTVIEGQLRAADVRWCLANRGRRENCDLPSAAQVNKRGFQVDSQGLYYRNRLDRPIFPPGWMKRFLNLPDHAEITDQPDESQLSEIMTETQSGFSAPAPAQIDLPSEQMSNDDENNDTISAAHNTDERQQVPDEGPAEAAPSHNQPQNEQREEDESDADDNDEDEGQSEETAPTTHITRRRIVEINDWYDPDTELMLPESCLCRYSDEVEDCLGKIGEKDDDGNYPEDDIQLKKSLQLLGEKGLFETLCQQHLLLLVYQLKAAPDVDWRTLMHRFRTIAETGQSLSLFRRAKSSWFMERGTVPTPAPRRRRTHIMATDFVDRKSKVARVDKEQWGPDALRQTIAILGQGPGFFKVRHDIFGVRRAGAYWDKEIETGIFGRHPIKDYMFLEAALYRQILQRTFADSQVDSYHHRHQIQCFYSIGQQLMRADILLYWMYAAMNREDPFVIWYPTPYSCTPSSKSTSHLLTFKQKQGSSPTSSIFAVPREFANENLCLSLKAVTLDEYGYAFKNKKGDFGEIASMIAYGRPPPSSLSKRYGFDQHLDLSWSPLSMAQIGARPYVDAAVRNDINKFLSGPATERANIITQWEEQALLSAQKAYDQLFQQEQDDN
ncbi:hypothetical protein KEM52_001097, partial [Ascosphaera acerosa]